MRISDWSSDVCSSDLLTRLPLTALGHENMCRATSAIEYVLIRRDTELPFGTCICSNACRIISATSSAKVGQNMRGRSEERRVGKDVSVRVDLGGRRIIKKQQTTTRHDRRQNI